MIGSQCLLYFHLSFEKNKNISEIHLEFKSMGFFSFLVFLSLLFVRIVVFLYATSLKTFSYPLTKVLNACVPSAVYRRRNLCSPSRTGILQEASVLMCVLCSSSEVSAGLFLDCGLR